MARPKDSETPEGRQRQEEKYQRILHAALQVFAAKGFHDSKISEIARTAGVADGTIYLYFKSKDDLLISLFEAELESINAGLRQALASIPEPPLQLDHAIRYHLKLAADNPTLAHFITIETRASSKFMKDYTKAQLAEYLDQFGDIIDRGKSNGDFRRDVSSGMCKHMIFGALDHACVTWVNNPNRQPEDLTEVGDFLIDFVQSALNERS